MIYARSDVCSVTISEAFGGCNQPHVRPAGVTLWSVSCSSCEGHLRGDPLWSPLPEQVPATFDELQHRKAMEQNAGRVELSVRDQVRELLARSYASEDLQLEAAQRGALPAGPPCGDCGAALLPGSRYCGGCGSPVFLREVGATAS